MEFNKDNITLADIYLFSSTNYKDNNALSLYGGSPITYASFGNSIDSLSATLLNSGISKGDKVAILGTNSPNWVISYFAITSIGAIAVPILPDFTAFEVVNIMEHSQASSIIVSSRFQYKVASHILSNLTLVINMDDLSISHSRWSGESCKMERPLPHDIASIIYTSGTTGSSKGVMLTHSNLLSQIEISYCFFPINSKDLLLSILPLPHAYEFSIGMLYPIAMGCHIVYLNGAPTASLLMPALKNVKPSIMLSVPLIVEKIYKLKIRPIFTKNLFLRALYSIGVIRRALHKVAGGKLLDTFGGNLRFFGIGGSKLDGVAERFLKDARFPYAIGYGLTETSPLLTAAPPGKIKWQSSGKAVTGVELKIIDANEKGVGEIAVKGPNVMSGYYKDPENTKRAFTSDGWFKTKDLGYLDKDGSLFIKGRRDNMFIGPNGENIYPEEIESIINDYDLVLESLVYKRQGRVIARVHFNYDEIKSGEYLIIESQESTYKERVEKIKKELLDFVNSRVNKSSKISEIVEQLAPFEKTATQKIKRFLYT